MENSKNITIENKIPIPKSLIAFNKLKKKQKKIRKNSEFPDLSKTFSRLNLLKSTSSKFFINKFTFELNLY